MKFYQSIHQQYNNIFPLNMEQISFVEQEIVTNGKILDIGCATGELAKKLATKNFHVKAFDLDPDMIDLAKENFNPLNPLFKTGNMLDIVSDYGSNYFDGILCFGNTMAHLTTADQIDKFLDSVYHSLKKEGKFLVQIINYKPIIEKEHFNLPIIDNDKIEFIRKYDILENGLINFKTKLIIKGTNQHIENEIKLFPITHDEIIKKLKLHQFKNIEVFGNFSKGELTSTSIPLVIKAQKATHIN